MGKFTKMGKEINETKRLQVSPRSLPFKISTVPFARITCRRGEPPIAETRTEYAEPTTG